LNGSDEVPSDEAAAAAIELAAEAEAAGAKANSIAASPQSPAQPALKPSSPPVAKPAAPRAAAPAAPRPAAAPSNSITRDTRRCTTRRCTRSSSSYCGADPITRDSSPEPCSGAESCHSSLCRDHPLRQHRRSTHQRANADHRCRRSRGCHRIYRPAPPRHLAFLKLNSKLKSYV
jgi:hypothetical protein